MNGRKARKMQGRCRGVRIAVPVTKRAGAFTPFGYRLIIHNETDLYNKDSRPRAQWWAHLVACNEKAREVVLSAREASRLRAELRGQE